MSGGQKTLEEYERRVTEQQQPAFACFMRDQRVSRIAMFCCCFLTIGVFYVAVVRLQVNRTLPQLQLPPLARSLSLESTPALPSEPVGAATQQATPAAATATPVASLIAAAPSAPPAPTPVASRPPASSAAGAESRAPASTPRSAAPAKTYVVQPGDTLFSIARRHQVTVASLVAANGLPSSELVKSGDKLRIP
ncbi:MAG: LysM peptidoglycan-binding domain-containing protein [Chloroflexota bacterium]|nr:LysM peptidoglycan-binding domain-containing protein [Chloroflexota bacterium]